MVIAVNVLQNITFLIRIRSIQPVSTSTQHDRNRMEPEKFRYVPRKAIFKRSYEDISGTKMRTLLRDRLKGRSALRNMFFN